MIKNVGTTDKIIRISLAVLLIILYVTNVVSGTLGIIILIAAALLILTSLFSFCLLYKVLGTNTCKPNTDDKPAEVSK